MPDIPAHAPCPPGVLERAITQAHRGVTAQFGSRTAQGCAGIIRAAVTAAAPIIGKAERERIRQLAIEHGTPELAGALAAMTSDLDGYITRKAEAVAAPVIAAAQ